MADAPRFVIVGLGNPGDEYAKTRHNVGFDVVDLLASRWGVAFANSKLLTGMVATASPAGLPVDRVRLVKPSTYMNLCGPSYAKALKVYETPAEGALLVVDDFMMEFGQIRLRPDGRSGGHNGLKSIEGSLGTTVYPRLKVGIGPVPPGRDPADFVLSRYSAVERKELPFLIEAAADAAVAWLTVGMERAMERHNRRPDAGV